MVPPSRVSLPRRRPHLYAAVAVGLLAVGLAAPACDGGSVGHTPVSRCVPEGACNEAMFARGLKAQLGDATRGAETYAQACVSCHGTDGAGRRDAGTGGVDFRSAAWHARFRDDELGLRIRQGKPPMMPAFGYDTEALRDLVAHLRALKQAPDSARPSGSGY